MGAMKSPIPDYLQLVLDNARANEDGAPAAYIETLAKADTSKMAVALAMVDGKVYSAGDDEVEFSIQVSHGTLWQISTSVAISTTLRNGS
jgi:glutaminase